MQLTPEFLFDLESNMETIMVDDHNALDKDLRWREFATVRQSESGTEHLNWILSTAKIERPDSIGEAIFEDMVMQRTEYTNEPATAGLELKREQMEDLDGNGVDLATNWSSQVGSQAAYWPQQVICDAIRSNPNTYDGLPFFSPGTSQHPVNPFKTSAGSFANHFTGAAIPLEGFPGASPIDPSVSLDDAINNLNDMLAYIQSIRMPNGRDPRRLRIRGIMVPPKLQSRAQQITKAQFIAQAATGGAGSGDVSSVIKNFNLGEPIVLEELGAAYGGSDTDYYLLTETITTRQMGAWVYIEREAFNVTFHGEVDDAQLARTRKLQWLTNGRNTVGPGHPYLMFKGSQT